MVKAATFRVDVTPPLGSPLCGGMVAPVAGITDPLYAIGVVLLGTGDPIVICAVDWCEINSSAHAAMQREIARAVGTDPDRVSLHTVHQHNAPIMDLGAQAMVSGAPGLGPIMDTAHFAASVEAVAAAARAACDRGRRVDLVALGSAPVREVASARRILGDDGKVRLTRWSSTTERELQEAPEGTIDPVMRTIQLVEDGSPFVALHYYATHPMSWYGDGLVTSDFAGLARERRRAETPGCEHVYFNGCGGDITAGKYNEGTPQSRARLADRIHAAMVQGEAAAWSLNPQPWSWKTVPVPLPLRPDLRDAELAALVADQSRAPGDRVNAALRLAFLRRMDTPCAASLLRLGAEIGILGLPAEAFIDYQLFAAARMRFVAVAAYADTGAGYVPLARSYDEGGYEISASSVGPGSEAVMKAAIMSLLDG